MLKTILRVFICLNLVCYSCSFSNGDNPANSTKKYNSPFCIYNVCFEKQPLLIDSLLKQSNYNGILMKVYSLEMSTKEINSFDSLKNKGYNKFPFKQFSEIPKLLKPHMDSNDIAYSFYQEKETFGYRLLVLNITKQKFILYDIGDLDFLYKK